VKIKAGIIGLGNIGSLFDEDPKRKEVWSHAGAYLSFPGVDLVAGADPDKTKLDKFAGRCPHAQLYQDYREMFSDRLDIVSICSPTPLHFEMVSYVANSGVKGIFCEKPIAVCVEDARKMVDLCRRQNIVLAVNHTRRWDQNYGVAKRTIEQGKIGAIRSVIGSYSDKVFMMGTHLLDMLRFYAGDVDWVVGEGANLESDDPGIGGILSFKNGASGFVTCNGKREDFIFQINIAGSEGRIIILDNGNCTEFYQFKESNRYSGYRELERQPLPEPKNSENALISAITDIVQCIYKGGQPSCTGEDGLKALELAVALCSSARDNNKKIEL